jgi:hypothetical protein
VDAQGPFGHNPPALKEIPRQFHFTVTSSAFSIAAISRAAAVFLFFQFRHIRRCSLSI